MHRLASTLCGLRLGKLSSRYSVMLLYRHHTNLCTSRYGGEAVSQKDSSLVSSKYISSYYPPPISCGVSLARRRGVTATALSVVEKTSDIVQAVEIECDGEVAVEFQTNYYCDRYLVTDPLNRSPPLNLKCGESYQNAFPSSERGLHSLGD